MSSPGRPGSFGRTNEQVLPPNGVDPAGLVGRRSGTDGLSVTGTAPDGTPLPTEQGFVTDFRSLQTTGHLH